MSKNEITIYSDGACLGNPGPGGYGVVLLWGPKRKELSGGFRLTTNNRMEILAVIKALQAISTKKRYNIKIYTDSRLVTNAFNEAWLTKWRQNDWKRNKKDKVLNVDLWKQLLNEVEKHDVEFHWVKGHADIPENERCDELARTAAQGTNLPIDTGYENKNNDNFFNQVNK
jgi:ribonuclease HI